MRRMAPTLCTPRGYAAAPGKVILLGEHAVVYGRPALAATIGRSVMVRVAGASSLHSGSAVDGPDDVSEQALLRALQLVGIDSGAVSVSISTDLPVGVGLGSSAALSVALVRALARYAGRAFDDATVCRHAFEMERIFHAFPSGIDNTVVTYGGVMAFKSGAAPRALRAAASLPLVIALGREPRRTRQTVTALRRRRELAPRMYESIFDDIERLVVEAEGALAGADVGKLGALMNANHELLRRLQVSTDELDVLVGFARAHGAAGAKLTGGGGGGAIICLCDGDVEGLLAAFRDAGWPAFATLLGTGKESHAVHDDRQLEWRGAAPA